MSHLGHELRELERNLNTAGSLVLLAVAYVIVCFLSPVILLALIGYGIYKLVRGIRWLVRWNRECRAHARRVSS
jgi:hypothetical protein